MRIHLDYGRTGLDVELPDQNVVGCLKYQTSPPLADPQSALRNCLERPIGSPPLRELARGRRTACVVISDVTRPVPNQILLPPILETLEAAGIARREILILVATGLHRPNLGDELAEMVGPWVAANYRIENHNGQDSSQHTYLGHSPRGLPVWIDSRYVQAELKIATGMIEPHFMAGFSGGRKAICPGLAALETIRVWHGPQFLEHPNARNGCLDGNPVHEENTAVAKMAGCDFIVNAVVGEGENKPAPIRAKHVASEARPGCCGRSALPPSGDRHLVRVVAGDMEAAFLEGVAFARGALLATLPKQADIVVTCSAGYPLDATFYQSIKGMVGALPIIRPGGTIIMAASLSEGIGSAAFRSLFDDNATLDGFMERILATGNGDSYFVMDQWQLEELAKVRRKAKVKVVSDGLPAETLRRLFVEPAESVETAVKDSLAEYGPTARIAVIPKGPYVLAELA
jgi:lactate racemase